MTSITIAGAALNQTPLDWPGNVRRILQAIADARAQGATLLCLPELCTTGYGCEDAFLSRGTLEAAELMVMELAPCTKGMIVSVGLPVHHMGGLYSTACLLVDGRPVGMAAKHKLAGDGVHYEPRWFKAWPRGARATTRIGSYTVPLGDLYFNVGGLRIGFEICEDAWAADRRGTDFADLGLDIICNPSASHFAFDKASVRRRLVQEGSRAFGAAYLYANLLGNEAGRVLYDGGVLIAHEGQIVAQGARLCFAEVLVTAAVVDVVAARLRRAGRASFTPRVNDDPARCITVDFDLASQSPKPLPVPPVPAWESSAHIKEEEFTRAVALGLFDYLRKSRARGFVISLSGGADSSAVTVLCRMALTLAMRELGPEGLQARLADVLPADATTSALTSDPAALTRALVTCVYQATQHSGPVTQAAARAVAEAVGAEFHVLDVEALVAGYVARVEQALGRKLDWEHDDIALQNIQARARAPGIWLIANLKNALLLSTSNRSEAAVGYATMDGDTSGGLAPIAGIDKAFLRRWLRWMETHGPAGLEPIAALAAVNAQQPTAELRPASAAQTDESDLMPYPILDAIEREAIRDKRTPAECWARLCREFPEHDPDSLRTWVVRFFRLWSRNQWKRERYAPSFHLDDKNLDPKTWCRFPILSGGFESELFELEQKVLV